MSLYRIATANTYDRTIDNINRRQSDLARSQEQLSSGKRVLRASDDAVAATLAERAQNRLSRVKADLTALEASRTALTQAESGLAEANDLLHRTRELVVQAGNPVLTANIREDLARQIEGLREQMLAVANRQDTVGMTIYGGLGGAQKPFVDLYGPNAGVQFQGQAGQYAATEGLLPQTLDGNAIWMRVAEGNGVVKVSLDAGNRGDVALTGAVTLTGTPVSPAPNFRLDFFADPADPDQMRFNVVDADTSAIVSADLPYTSPPPVAVSIPVSGETVTFSLAGTPQQGDSVDVLPNGDPATAYTVVANMGNIGQACADQAIIVDPSMLTGDSYAVEFANGIDGIEFRIVNTSDGGVEYPDPFAAPVQAYEKFQSGKTVTFDGIQLTLQGAPLAGDRVFVEPSETSDLFATMQRAIDALRYGGANQSAYLTQEIGRVLSELDTGMNRVLDARGRVGDWLNRADSMQTVFDDKAVFHQKEKSDQEDLDMVKGISDFENQQVALQAALQSYAQVQKLSLFQYIA